jgi:hypothetical protein
MEEWVRLFGRFVFYFILVLQSYTVALAEEGMIYIHNAPESLADKRYEYHWKILRTALERTHSKYGKYSFKPSILMSKLRQVSEIKMATEKITVMHLGTSRALEKKLIPI